MEKSMETLETTTKVVPVGIAEHIGGSFVVGIVGASAFYFIKVMYNSPAGSRFSGAAQAVRMNAPSFGGRLAVWAALYSSFNAALVYVRKKEDPWNSILSASAASGVCAMTMSGGTLGAAVRAAAVTGSLFALLGGTEMMLLKAQNAQQNETSTSQMIGQSILERSSALEAGSGSSPRFGSFFEQFRFRRAVPQSVPGSSFASEARSGSNPRFGSFLEQFRFRRAVPQSVPGSSFASEAGWGSSPRFGTLFEQFRFPQ